MKIPRWGGPNLESSLPHIIVDSSGVPRSLPFKSRSAATRALNQMRRKPSPLLLGDPKTWHVEPVREA
jgi:hypothetical protein